MASDMKPSDIEFELGMEGQGALKGSCKVFPTPENIVLEWIEGHKCLIVP